MLILGIESSCDETSAAVVADGRVVLSNVVASQIDLHAAFGGVVPEIAARQHVVWLVPVLQEALARAGVGWSDLHGVAVTQGPGLAGALLVGVNMAKTLAFALDLPLIGINHIEAHIYANWLVDTPPTFPCVALVVSGGHSDLLLVRGHGLYTLLGSTRDDAAGEAFDKVARILGLGYPGGPAIQAAAREGDPSHAKLPRAWLGQSYDFSFSGLKTAVLRMVESERRGSIADIAAGFQDAVVDVLVEKTRRAADALQATEVLMAGGVAANLMLRQELARRIKIPVRFPPVELCTDNAAMVAAAGFYNLEAGRHADLDMDVLPAASLT